MLRQMIPIVMKFGGAAAKSPNCFSLLAKLILKNCPVVAVISAMGNMTNQLMNLAEEVHPNPPPRELDMLLSVGERISMSLLAMALAKRGVKAVSYTGSQAGIITSEDHSEARIIDVKPTRIQESLAAGSVVVVAGFQGVSRSKEITTLGRGGSDTTAVALAVALGAKCVEFYKDVEGIYDQYPDGKICRELNYQQAHSIAQKGEVLHPRCLKLAEKNQMPLHVRSFELEKSLGTWIREKTSPGCPEYESLLG